MADEVNGKLDSIIKKVDHLAELVESLEIALCGDVKQEKVGVLERIRRIEAWIDGRRWFEKIVLVAVIGNLVGLIFILIQSFINQ